jgi:D-alanine-D-alanine ligase
MPKLTESCLVIHNLPRRAQGATAWAESDAGVLAEVEAVVAGLRRLGVTHRVAGVPSLHDIPAALAGGSETLVFNLVESLEGEPADANFVPAVCQAHGKAVTGCDTPSLILTMDKGRTKAVLEAAGLPCPRGVTVPVGHPVQKAPLPEAPWIVKPAHSDASEGIDAGSIVERFGAGLRKAVMRIHDEFDQPAVIEQYVGHRELNVSVLQRGREVQVLPLAEIDFSAFDKDRPKIVDYAAKWLPGSFAYQNTPRIIPARLPRRLADHVRRLVRDTWDAVGCQDYARVDCRLDHRGRVFILEVNANPDISPDAGLAAALTAAGIGYDEFVRILLENAAARHKARVPKPAPRKRSAAPVPASKAVAEPDRKEVCIRQSEARDRDAVLRMLEGTGFFRPDELEIAREVLDEALDKGPTGHYQSFVAEDDAGSACGWVCFGPTPCTLGTFDIYWIVVDPTRQTRGTGKALMAYAERLIAERGGRLVVAETSGLPRYEPTRRFYLKIGYHEACRAKDFYAPGDDKVLYSKFLT